jgi:hypothetical protein
MTPLRKKRNKRNKPESPAPPPKRADSVTWQVCVCGCGHFYFELIDARGRAFAQAWMRREDLLRAAESMVAVAEDRATGIHFRH